MLDITFNLFMNPEQFKLLVDVIVILIGVWSMISLRRAAVGGKFGAAMNLILAGIFVLTLNHFSDTIFVASFLKMTGHTNDYLQPAIVHRIINLAGFILMALGFATFSR